MKRLADAALKKSAAFNDIIARLENVENARGAAVDGPIQVGRFGKTPVGYSGESTVRYRLNPRDSVDVRVEPGSLRLACGDKRRLRVNLGNGLWFPIGGMLFVGVYGD
ncbi:MAG: hypothetical protein ACRD1P_00315 [Thermoanaerobaculia bacterium]